MTARHLLSRFEEWTPTLRTMNPSARPQTSRNRDGALRRLNSITTGTAMAAAVATAGFGALAAINYAGTTSAAGADGSSSAEDSSQDLPVTTDSATTDPVAPAGLQPTTAPIVASKHKARVTSGGSH